MRYPLTKNAAERNHVATLRHAVPPVPEEWREKPRHIRRLNSEDAPGVFCQRFVSGDLRIAFISLPPTGRVQITVSRDGSEPTEVDIARIRTEWFADAMLDSTPPLNGVSYLRLGPVPS